MDVKRILCVAVLLEMVMWCLVTGNCDDDWTEYDGYCYYVSHSKTTWNDAEVQCQQKMATLASIRNKKDNHFLTTITDLTNKDYWIGLKKNAESQRWVWADGSNVSYSNWLDNGRVLTTGNCVRITRDGYWSANDCSTNINHLERPMLYLCEKEAAHKYPQKRNEDGGKYYVTVGGRHGLELVLPLVLSAIFIALVIIVDILAIYYCKRFGSARITIRSHDGASRVPDYGKLAECHHNVTDI